MDMLNLFILGLRVATLFFFLWYFAEKCCALYAARKAKEKRRVRFQTVWGSSLCCNDELDSIITAKEDY